MTLYDYVTHECDVNELPVHDKGYYIEMNMETVLSCGEISRSISVIRCMGMTNLSPQMI